MSVKNKIIMVIGVVFLIFLLTISFINIKSMNVNQKKHIDSKSTLAINNLSDYKGTIINVPIDSRPISRSNFESLVKTAGYNYIEFNAGLDSMNSSGIYRTGNSLTLRNEVSSNIENYNSADTTAIINLSSYFFGGLIGTRDNKEYSDKDTKIESLKSLIATYNNPNYYVIINIPRTYPDSRVMNFPISKEVDSYGQQLTNTTKVKGLIDYYNKTTTPTTTFEQAAIEWLYIKYWTEIEGNKFEDLPNYVKTFTQEFYENKYKTFLNNYFEIYTKNYEYIIDLLNLKDQLLTEDKKDFELIITIDDDNVANFIKNNVNNTENPNFNFIEKNNLGDIIKVGPSYYIEQTLKGSDYILIPGTDELNHMILARDLVKKTGVGIEFNYKNPVTNLNVSNTDLNFVGTYDTYTVGGNLTLRANFINEYAESKLPIDVYLTSFKGIFEGGYNLSSKDAITGAKNIYLNNNKKAVIGVSYFDEELLEQLVQQGNIYDLTYSSAWNTVGNSLGIGLSSITVGLLLDEEMSKASEITPLVEQRLQNYMQYKLLTIIEGAVYNNNKGNVAETNSELTDRIKYVKGKGKEYGSDLIKEINYNGTNLNHIYSTGKFKYIVKNATFTANRPWNRTFEVKITPNLTIEIKENQYRVEHYKQNIDGTYNDIPDDIDTLKTIEPEVTPLTKTYNGFTQPELQKITLDVNNETIIKYYYSRNEYEVTIKNSNGVENITGIGTHKFEKEVVLTATPKIGYENITWIIDDQLKEDNNLKFSMPNHNVEIEVNTTPIEYKITYNLTGGIIENNVTTYTVESDDIILPIPKKEGYKFIGWQESEVSTPQEEAIIKKGTIGDKVYTAVWELIINEEIIDNTKDKEVLYDGKEHSLDIKLNIEDYQVMYSIDGKNYSTEVPKFKYVGEYNIYYKILVDDEEIKTGNKKVKIYGVQKIANNINIKNNIIITKNNSFSNLINNFTIYALQHTKAHYDNNNNLKTTDTLKTTDVLLIRVSNFGNIKYNISLLGDINGDSKINSADYIKIKKHIMKTEEIKENIYFYAADVNNDNTISSKDYIKIRKYIMNQESL